MEDNIASGSCNIKDRRLSSRSLSALHFTCSKTKLITINILFMKIRQLVVRRIRIRSPAPCESAPGNQPLRLIFM